MTPVPEVVAIEKEMEGSIPVSEAVSFEGDILGQEDTGFPIVEPTILDSGEGVSPVVEDPLPRETITLKTEAAIPTTASEMTTPTVRSGELEVPITDVPVELTQDSFFLTITRGPTAPVNYPKASEGIAYENGGKSAASPSVTKI